MRVFVHPDLELSATTLVDTPLGVRYMLTPDAAWLVCAMRQEPCIERLVPVVARRQALSEAAAKRATYQLMGLLDAYGGIRIIWDHSFSPLVRFRAGMLWRVRYKGNCNGFVRSVTRAYWLWLVCLTTVVGCTVMFARGALPTVWLVVPSAVFMTCVIHEAGHALAAKTMGVPFVFLARFASAAMLYRTPTGWQARVIAVCGPLSAVLFSVLGVMTSHTASGRLLWLTAVGLHVASVLPFLADGKTIWRKL